MRDQIVDFVRYWSEKTEIGVGRFIVWLGIAASKLYNWRDRYGKVNEHNGWIPWDFWLEKWEKDAYRGFPSEESAGRLSAADVMMLDARIVAVSPSSVWRVGARGSGVVSPVERAPTIVGELRRWRDRFLGDKIYYPQVRSNADSRH